MINFVIILTVAAILTIINIFGEKLNKRYFWLAVAGIMIFGFALRLLSILLIPCEPVSDYKTMFSAAESFAMGNRPFAMGSYFQRFPHMTTYSVLCGFIMKIFGTDVFVIKIFNVLFKTAAIFAAGLIGRELFGKRGMLSAAFLYAVFPPDILYTPTVATENFALTFLLFSLFLYIKAYKAEKKPDTAKYAALSGLILSAGCLIRGVAPFYMCAYLAGIVLLFKGIRKKCLSAAALVLAFVLVFQAVGLAFYHSGITEYKLSDTGEPYIVYILVGTNFETGGMYSAEDHGVYLEAGENPALASKMAKERLVKRLSENTDKIIPLLIKKTDTIWSDGSFNAVYWSMIENGEAEDNPLASDAQLFSKWFYRFLLILTLAALIFYKKRGISCLLLLLPVMFECGLMLMEIQPRYTYSVAYIFVIFGTAGFCALFDYIKLKIGRNFL